jgi:hypothetical protein
MSNTLHRRLAVIAGLVISLLLLTGAALAVDTTLTGTITTSDTAFTDCDTNYAKVMPFTVSETGTYTLDSAAPPYDVATTFFYAAVVSNVTPRMNDAPMLDVINNSPLFASASINLTAGTTYYLVVGGDAACNHSVYPLSYSFQVHGPGSFVFGTAFQSQTDGRVNRDDHAAPVAVYPISYGNGQMGLHVYDTATGVLLLEVTPELIAATDGVSENTLIAEGGNVVVYRLADGTFYVGAPMANGKQYILTFAELSTTTAYSSTEVE